MFYITDHAREQCKARRINVDQVLRVVNRKAGKIATARVDPLYDDVKVVVGKFARGSIELRDGSWGDTVVACVCPWNGAIVTVMPMEQSKIDMLSKKMDFV